MQEEIFKIEDFIIDHEKKIELSAPAKDEEIFTTLIRHKVHNYSHTPQLLITTRLRQIIFHNFNSQF